jgi:heat shock protein HslJ
MDENRTRNGNDGSTPVEIQALISMFAAAVLMTAIALLAIFIAGPQPPRLRLTDPTWQWTSWTTRAGEAPLAVPDPAAYTIQFMRDGTFAAVADCNQVAGTYGVNPAGRGGGGTDGLSIDPAPASLAACGAGSLSEQFLQQLGSSSQYLIQGSQLTIRLAPRGTITFQAPPVASPSPAP